MVNSLSKGYRSQHICFLCKIFLYVGMEMKKVGTENSDFSKHTMALFSICYVFILESMRVIILLAVLLVVVAVSA